MFSHEDLQQRFLTVHILIVVSADFYVFRNYGEHLPFLINFDENVIILIIANFIVPIDYCKP